MNTLENLRPTCYNYIGPNKTVGILINAAIKYFREAQMWTREDNMSKMKDRFHMGGFCPPDDDAKEALARTAAGSGGLEL